MTELVGFFQKDVAYTVVLVSSFIRSFPHTLAASSFLPIFLVPLLERYPSFVPRFLLAAYKIHVILMEFGMWKPTVISALRNHKKFIPSSRRPAGTGQFSKSWFARVNALCNLSRKKSRKVAAVTSGPISE